MERRKQIETEVGWFSMKIEREVLDETKLLAQKEGISLAGYVSNLMKDAVYNQDKKDGTEAVKSEIAEVKDSVCEVFKRMDKLEDKIDCISIMVTKILGRD